MKAKVREMAKSDAQIIKKFLIKIEFKEKETL